MTEALLVVVLLVGISLSRNIPKSLDHFLEELKVPHYFQDLMFYQCAREEKINMIYSKIFHFP